MPTCYVCGREAKPAEITPGYEPSVNLNLQNQWYCTGCNKLTRDCACGPVW